MTAEIGVEGLGYLRVQHLAVRPEKRPNALEAKCSRRYVTPPDTSQLWPPIVPCAVCYPP